MVISPFQLINPNMPAASAGQLPDLLGMFGTPPLLNSYTPVQTPLQQMLGTPEPIGSPTRPYPLGAFPNDTADQYVSSAQSSTTQPSSPDPITDSSSSSSVQAGANGPNNTGVTPNAAGVDGSDSTAFDSGTSDTGGEFYSVFSHIPRLNILA